ncbi:MAG: T9SS type A sorting domain-containing protein [Bacteroidota bacterium]
MRTNNIAAKAVIVLLMLTFFHNNGYNQALKDCGTSNPSQQQIEALPWYGNNDYLLKLKDKLKQKKRALAKNNEDCEGGSSSTFVVPIQFWIYEEFDGEFPFDIEDVQRIIDYLNTVFSDNGVDVRFTARCTSIETDPGKVDVGAVFSTLNFPPAWSYDFDAIHVHVVRDLNRANGVWNVVSDYIVVQRNIFITSQSTLAHELGHYLGLLHPHQFAALIPRRCFRESVSRTRRFGPLDFFFCPNRPTGRICERSADALCDTPADFNLSEDPLVSCQFMGMEPDPWGEIHDPDESNIMSYAFPRTCRTAFSPMQATIMENVIYSGAEVLGHNRDWMLALNLLDVKPDVYEPNNESITARGISLGERQCHTFHNWQGCDEDMEDWLLIDANSPNTGFKIAYSTYSIDISDIEGFDNPVEIVQIFEFDPSAIGNLGNEIIPQVSSSGTAQTFTFTPTCNTNYLVRIAKSANVERGKYTALLKEEVSAITVPNMDKDLLCIGDQLEVQNLPPGATVLWFPNPNVVLSNSTGNSTTVLDIIDAVAPSRCNGFISDRTPSVAVRIIINGCQYNLCRQYLGGPELLPQIEIVQIGAAPCITSDGSLVKEGLYRAVDNSNGNAPVEVTWSASNNGTLSTMGPSANVSFTPSNIGQFSLTADFMNECGESTSRSQSFVTEECEIDPIIDDDDCDDTQLTAIRDSIFLALGDNYYVAYKTNDSLVNSGEPNLYFENPDNTRAIGDVVFDKYNDIITTASIGQNTIEITKQGEEGFAWVLNHQTNDGQVSSSDLAVDDADASVIYTGSFSSDFSAGNLGTINSYGLSDIILVKINSSGQEQWMKQAGGFQSDAALSIGTNNQEETYVTGYIGGPAAFDGEIAFAPQNKQSMFVAKYQADGTAQWVRIGTHATNANFENSVLLTDSEGNVIVAGDYIGNFTLEGSSTPLTADGNSGEASFIAKYNPQGQLRWSKRVGKGVGIHLSSIIIDEQDNVTVAGEFSGTSQFGEDQELISNGGLDIFFAKFDGSGNLFWLKQQGEENDESIHDFTTDGSGQFVYTATATGSTNLEGESFNTGDDCITVDFNCNAEVTSDITDADCGQSNGAIDLTVTGEDNLSYKWSNDATTEDIAGLVAGFYTVTITGGANCALTRTYEIRDCKCPPNFEVNLINQTNVSCNGLSDGSLTVEGIGGNAPYTYEWSNDATTATISNLAVATYSVTVRDVNDCDAIASYTITEPSVLIASIEEVGGATCSASDGWINLTILGGQEPYTIDWDNDGIGDNDDPEDLINIAAGTYKVTVTDANACSDENMATIGSSGELSLSAVVTDANCGENNGAIDLTITDGQEPYTIDWDNDGIGDNDDSEDLTNLAAGEYKVTVTDVNGCTDNATIMVGSSSGLSLSTTSTDASCGANNGTIDLTISGGQTPYTIDWDNNGTMDNDDPEDLINLAAGDYKVTVTDVNGCSASTTATVGSSGGLSLSTTVTDASCGTNNGAIDLTISGGQAPYTIDWDNDGIGDNDDTEDLADLAGGDYKVTVTDINGCSSSTTATVSSSDVISLSTVVSNASCGVNNGSIDLSITGGQAPYTIDWDNDGTGDNDDLEDLTDLAPGNYTVEVTDADGCTASSTISVVANGSVDIDTDVTFPTTCNASNGAISITISGGTPPYQTDWLHIDGDQNPETVSDLPPGKYELLVTDANGCTLAGSIELIHPSSNLRASFQSIGTDCSGNGGSISFSAINGVPPYSYYWRPYGDLSWSSFGPTATDSHTANLPSGLYEVFVADANSCIYAGAAEIGYANNLLSLQQVNANNASCGADNGSIEVVTAQGVPPLTYELTNNAQVNENVTSNADTYLFTDLPADTYDITVSDANGCSVNTTATIGSSGGLSLSTEVTNASCGENNGTIDLTISGGQAPYTIDWDNDGTGDNDDTEDLANLAAGDYNVTVTDVNGCSSITTATVGSSSGLSLSTEVTDASCGANNGAIDLTISGGQTPYTIDWDNDGTGDNDDAEDLANLAAGDYNVTVSDANGCSASTTATVGSSDEVSLSTMVTDASCGVNNGAINLTISGGQTPYTIDWDNDGTGDNDDTEDLNNLTAGDYNVTVTDANGCSANTTATVSSSGGLMVVPNLTPPSSCSQSNGAISLSISNGTPPYTVDWAHLEDGNDGGIVEDLKPGVYPVTVTDVNDCQEILDIDLTSPDSDLRATFEGVGTNCQGAGGAIDITVTDGVAPYTYSKIVYFPGLPNPIVQNSGSTSSTNYRFENVERGFHEVFVKDANGCEYHSTVEVKNAENLLQIQNILGVEPACNSSDGSITINTTNGVLPITYEISDNAQFSQTISSNSDSYTFTNLAAANYDITVTDQGGCTATRTYRLDNASSLSISGVATDAYCGENGSINLTITGGQKPYQIDWDHLSGNNNPEDVDQLGRGTYTVVVTDADNCSKERNFDIFEGNNLRVNFYSNIADCTGQNGGIYFEVTSGAAPYTYSWRQGFGAWQSSASISASTYTADGLSAGTYEARVVDADGCEQSQNVVVSQRSGPSISYGTVSHNCSSGGGTINTNVSGGRTPYNYSWENRDTNSDAGDEPNLTVTGIDGNYRYKVTVTDSEGCSDTPSDGRRLYEKLTTSPKCSANGTSGRYDVRHGKDGGSSSIDFTWTLNGSPYGSNGNFTTQVGEMGNFGLTMNDRTTGCSVSGSVNVPNDCSSSANENEILSITVSNEYELSVFPNPFNSNLQVHIVSSQQEQLEIRLYDQLGRVLYRQHQSIEVGVNKFFIDLSAQKTLGNGIYHLLILSEDGRNELRKILRQE